MDFERFQHTRPYRLSVRTSPFQGEKRSSTLRRVTGQNKGASQDVFLFCTLVELSKQTALLASESRKGSPLFSKMRVSSLRKWETCTGPVRTDSWGHRFKFIGTIQNN